MGPRLKATIAQEVEAIAHCWAQVLWPYSAAEHSAVYVARNRAARCLDQADGLDSRCACGGPLSHHTSAIACINTKVNLDIIRHAYALIGCSGHNPSIASD